MLQDLHADDAGVHAGVAAVAGEDDGVVDGLTTAGAAGVRHLVFLHQLHPQLTQRHCLRRRFLSVCTHPAVLRVVTLWGVCFGHGVCFGCGVCFGHSTGRRRCCGRGGGLAVGAVYWRELCSTALALRLVDGVDDDAGDAVEAGLALVEALGAEAQRSLEASDERVGTLALQEGGVNLDETVVPGDDAVVQGAVGDGALAFLLLNQGFHDGATLYLHLGLVTLSATEQMCNSLTGNTLCNSTNV